MPEEIASFFEELDRRPHEPLLQGISGTVRFDLQHDTESEQWLLKIDDGRVRVSKSTRQETADTVFVVERSEFEKGIRGEVNLIAGMLRGSVAIEGSMRLAVMVERLLPGPPDARGPRYLRCGEHETKEPPTKEPPDKAPPLEKAPEKREMPA